MNKILSFLILATTIQYGCTQGNSVHRQIIVSDKVPETLAFYSHAVQVDNVLYISGNLGMTIDGYLVDGVTNQTKLALENIGHILEAAGVSFDHGTNKKNLISKEFLLKICMNILVVKVTVILSDMEDYGAMNDVYKLCNAKNYNLLMQLVHKLFFYSKTLPKRHRPDQHLWPHFHEMQKLKLRLWRL